MDFSAAYSINSRKNIVVLTMSRCSAFSSSIKKNYLIFTASYCSTWRSITWRPLTYRWLPDLDRPSNACNSWATRTALLRRRNNSWRIPCTFWHFVAEFRCTRSRCPGKGSFSIWFFQIRKVTYVQELVTWEILHRAVECFVEVQSLLLLVEAIKIEFFRVQINTCTNDDACQNLTSIVIWIHFYVP